MALVSFITSTNRGSTRLHYRHFRQLSPLESNRAHTSGEDIDNELVEHDLWLSDTNPINHQQSNTLQLAMTSSVVHPEVVRHHDTGSQSRETQEALRLTLRHSPNNEAFACTHCDKTFKIKEALQQHRRNSSAHALKSAYTDCNNSFKNEDALQRHLRDSPAHKTTFSCTDCKKSFKTEQALKQHRQSSPAHATNFTCTNCNKSFKTREALQQHQRDLAHARRSDHSDSDGALRSEQPVQQFKKSSIRSSSSWSMYPSLHDEVSRLLEADDLSFEFCEADDSKNSIHEHDTNVMGRFICKNRACSSSGWSSKCIAITIQMYPEELYNARVYKQRCQSCRRLGQQPTLDHSYAERVAYRLKKWCGIQMELPHYSGTSKGPHQSALCEGCRNGHCSEQAKNTGL